MIADSRSSKGTVFLVDKHLSTDISSAEGSNKQSPLIFGGGAQTSVANGANGTKPRQGASLQYLIPAPYRELLDRIGASADPSSQIVQGTADPDPPLAANQPVAGLQCADSVGDATADNVQADDTKTSAFWPAVRKLARRRVESKEPDVEPWEHRASKFHESLWIEELRMELEMVQWRLKVDALPNVSDGLYRLDITALSDRAAAPLEEKGLLRGVNVHLECSKGKTYRAMVQPGSRAGSLLLSSSAPLESAKGPFDVRFHPNRFQQLAMHRALDAPQNCEFLRTFHDEPAPVPSPSSMEEVTDTLPASLNDDQRRAVAAVLTATTKRPLIIWGPPGTGKSTLAAFVIWHLVQQRPNNLHILAAAPSNTGADVLCKKLGRLGLDTEQVLRLNALGRNVSTVPDDILQFCYTTMGDDGRPSFAVPALSKARKYKVIVTTCIAATHLVNALRSEGSGGWFSHVIVDEAGEATEPETLVPLTLLREVAGSTILLGDHFQLGPLVMSRLASQLSELEVSMIERLANERFSAVRDGEDRSGLSRDALVACEDYGLYFLTESYRSHPAITELYSNIFYASQLAHSERAQQFSLMQFFQARGFSVPIILHNVVGQERRDDDSPSVYNVEELRAVQQYLVELLTDADLGLHSSEIGIITPYTKQLQFMQEQLVSSGSNFAGVECGTVEWFQGQERNVVIMSTVRCSRLADGSEAGAGAERRPIGFVADPKRLNVAISRAVAGLIIVGDLQTLASHSSHWRQLIDAAKGLGCVTGEPLTDSLGMSSSAGAELEKMLVPPAQATAAWDALTG